MAANSKKSLEQSFNEQQLSQLSDDALVNKLISTLEDLCELESHIKLKVSFLDPHVNVINSADNNSLELTRLAISREIFDRIEFAYEGHPKLHYSSLILQKTTNYPKSLEWKEGKGALETLALFEKLNPSQLKRDQKGLGLS